MSVLEGTHDTPEEGTGDGWPDVLSKRPNRALPAKAAERQTNGEKARVWEAEDIKLSSWDRPRGKVVIHGPLTYIRAGQGFCIESGPPAPQLPRPLACSDRVSQARVEKDLLSSAPEAPRKTHPPLKGRLLRCTEQEDPFFYHLEFLWTPSQHTQVVSLSACDSQLVIDGTS